MYGCYCDEDRYDGDGSCASRSGGQCGCCSSGYLYGCAGSCGESPKDVGGVCSSRASDSCGCCDAGIIHALSL